jgi:hypothetical protein
MGELREFNASGGQSSGLPRGRRRSSRSRAPEPSHATDFGHRGRPAAVRHSRSTGSPRMGGTVTIDGGAVTTGQIGHRRLRRQLGRGGQRRGRQRRNSHPQQPEALPCRRYVFLRAEGGRSLAGGGRRARGRQRSRSRERRNELRGHDQRPRREERIRQLRPGRHDLPPRASTPRRGSAFKARRASWSSMLPS